MWCYIVCVHWLLCDCYNAYVLADDCNDTEVFVGDYYDVEVFADDCRDAKVFAGNFY